jgi:hypothetical protein
VRISFERNGGFANIPLRSEIDSAEMAPERVAKLKRLVERARPFDQSAQPHDSVAIPDDFHYEITIEDAGQTHTVRISDAAATDDLKLLFDFLGEEALRKLRQG